MTFTLFLLFINLFLFAFSSLHSSHAVTSVNIPNHLIPHTHLLTCSNCLTSFPVLIPPHSHAILFQCLITCWFGDFFIYLFICYCSFFAFESYLFLSCDTPFPGTYWVVFMVVVNVIAALAVFRGSLLVNVPHLFRPPQLQGGGHGVWCHTWSGLCHQRPGFASRVPSLVWFRQHEQFG